MQVAVAPRAAPTLRLIHGKEEEEPSRSGRAEPRCGPAGGTPTAANPAGPLWRCAGPETGVEPGWAD